MKTKLKPRKMWANYHPQCPVPDTFDSKARAINWAESYSATVKTVPVAVIPLDDVEALIKKAMDAYHEDRFATFKGAMRAALTAIGVLPKKKGCK